MASARLKLNRPSSGASTDKVPPLYAGQPVSAVISINTSFHWGGNSDDGERKYMLRFDVEEMLKDWLVSGRKRGDFLATVIQSCISGAIVADSSYRMVLRTLRI